MAKGARRASNHVIWPRTILDVPLSPTRIDGHTLQRCGVPPSIAVAVIHVNMDEPDGDGDGIERKWTKQENGTSTHIVPNTQYTI